jgi:Fic family protein
MIGRRTQLLTTNSSTADRQATRRAEQSVQLPSSIIERIQAEYVEMPGLSVTLPQAVRLWGLSVPQSEQLLSTLVQSGFLLRDKKGIYRRRR